MSPAQFGSAVRAAQAAGRLVVQPRMGFGDPRRMRLGLAAVKGAAAATVGTLTVDSYTRLGLHDAARAALRDGSPLNGYPIVAHEARTTQDMLRGIMGDDFPVQVRHGSAQPQAIITALRQAGLHATEGGPVSYCLPYSRTPVRTATASWVQACALLVDQLGSGPEPHLETFGGCMLGQLCPPSLLVAISLLEGMFFAQQGLRSISLSYAQQTNAEQDEEAVRALSRLATELLDVEDWHIVVYAYMGQFPRTQAGADGLLADAAVLAVRTGAARLIVKTAVEAHRIPTIGENVAALRLAADAAATAGRQPYPVSDTETYREARMLVEAVLDLDDDLGMALATAVERGVIDVPFCLHPDNAGQARSRLDGDGWLRWSRTGAMPIPVTSRLSGRTTSDDLLASLSYLADRYDSRPLAALAASQIRSTT